MMDSWLPKGYILKASSEVPEDCRGGQTTGFRPAIMKLALIDLGEYANMREVLVTQAYYNGRSQHYIRKMLSESLEYMYHDWERWS